MALPDFLVIGAPKAGTSALHAALAAHPQLFLSTPKEPKYFLTDGRPPTRATQRGPGDAHSAREWIWHREGYERLFDAAPAGTLCGESTPFYLWDRGAHRRIAATVPDARLIAVVRDPIDRAYSNWMHLRADGLEPEPDFGRACDLEDERAGHGWAPFWRYLGLGRARRVDPRLEPEELGRGRGRQHRPAARDPWRRAPRSLRPSPCLARGAAAAGRGPAARVERPPATRSRRTA